ncbi:coenzyme F420-0:L-glutamate ligase [Mycetohabitans sp. B8]|nr:coenzyme F420-0:L-glutamate ligase [Mycetohabitans sp. B8]
MSNTTAQNVRSMTISAIPGIPLIKTGDDLGQIIAKALSENGIVLSDGDVLVLAQKIVSKAEGRWVALSSVTPSRQAIDLAQQVGKDPRHVEVVLSESDEVIAYSRKNALITAHRLGFVMGDAGIDHSNVGDDGLVLLLPKDPDSSARQLKKQLHDLCGADVRIIINDSFGRGWRCGSIGTTIGIAGFSPIKNYIGKPDLFGRVLQTSRVAVADELAAAASFMMGQADEGAPVVMIRGADLPSTEGTTQQLIRPKEDDLFRKTSSTIAVKSA